MKGLVKKKHFFLIWYYFGFKTAFRILTCSDETALKALCNLNPETTQSATALKGGWKFS